MRKKRIAVIGGGAAGMMAAISAAGQGCQITLWEGNDRVGKKLLATGNGKCNFSNLVMDHSHYYSSDAAFVEQVLGRFGVRETTDFFTSLGMLIREKDGYLYPASEQSSTVLDLLRLELQNRGIWLETEAKVDRILQEKDGRFLVGAGEKNGVFDRVILACGSKASPRTGSDGSGYQLARSLGHTVNQVVPALVQLRCAEKDLKSVAGVRSQARVRLMVDGREVAAESGELQLTDYGISGIVVFQISRIAAYALERQQKVTARIDFFRDMQETEYEAFAEQRIRKLSQRTVEEFFTGMLNKKLMLYFIRQAGLKVDMPIRQADPKKVQKVFALCRDWELHIQGVNSFDNAQVCAGGVPLQELTERLESKKVPGLYLAGELLDVDGKCGGYNLQWAWSSGYIAGKSAAEE